MKQWIRWSGLAAFIVIAVLLTVFFAFAAGPLVKWSLESAGSEIAGARVDVGDVSLTFSPFGFTLQQVTVADAREPMQNALEFSSATAAVDIAPLFLGKAIIRDLSVDGLQFGTARQTSGALEKKAQTDSTDSAAEESSLQDKVLSVAELPSADEILARESLHTEAAGAAFQQSYKTNRAAVDAALEGVPDNDALAAYQAELQALTGEKLTSVDDFKERKAKLDALKKRFAADKAAVAAAKQAIADARTDIAARLTDLRSAPADDMAAIRSKYQLNAGGAANLTALLFGDQAGEWARQALYWYEKIQPYLSSSADGDSAALASEERLRDGRFVHFPSADPWPEFLLRNARISATLPGGKLLITAQDITHQQAVLGRPAHILVNGSGLQQVEELTADIVLDHRSSAGNDSLTLTVKDWQVQDMNLGLADTRMTSSLVQVQGLAVVSGGKLNAKADAQFGAAAFASKSKTTLAQELVAALASIDRFDVNASAGGDFRSPDVRFGSDLDRQLSAAFSRRLNQKQAELEARLQKQLQEKLQAYTGDYADELQQLNELDGSLSDKADALQEMASAKLEDYETQQKREAEEKAKAKEDALKQKAKDKLKSLF